MKKFLLAIGSLALLILALRAAAPLLVPPTPIKTLAVTREDLTITVSPTTISTVTADYEVRLAPEVSGQIVHLPWEEGDRVAAGGTLFRIDPATYEGMARRAEANVRVAEARLRSGAAGRKLEAEQIELAIAAARTALDLARKTADRSGNLVGRGGAAVARHDAELQAYEVALSTYDAKVSMRAKLDLLDAEAALNAALLAQARADLDLARVNLARCETRAPFDGVVARRYAQSGEFAAPGAPVLAFVDPDRLYVNALIDEVDIPHIAVGRSCEILLDAYPGLPLAGRVTRISPVITGLMNQSKTFAVRAVPLSSRGAILKPGQSCDVRIHVETVPRVLTVSSQAVVEKGGRKWVYVVREGRLLRREVTLGRTNGTDHEVLAGLAEGETITAALDSKSLVEGARVVAETERP